jgi:hypothetical protein
MMPGFLETATFVSHSSTRVGPLQDCTKTETIGSIQLKVAAKPPNVNKKATKPVVVCGPRMRRCPAQLDTVDTTRFHELWDLP